ncbi:MAG: hypothetical protein J3R72DRAFT_139068 [Linnemannia gamsii]|nr:MAG: hypothetical protein J3R72DRAFT_139068 [Linnemannia gamsii]
MLIALGPLSICSPIVMFIVLYTFGNVSLSLSLFSTSSSNQCNLACLITCMLYVVFIYLYQFPRQQHRVSFFYAALCSFSSVLVFVVMFAIPFCCINSPGDPLVLSSHPHSHSHSHSHPHSHSSSPPFLCCWQLILALSCPLSHSSVLLFPQSIHLSFLTR